MNGLSLYDCTLSYHFTSFFAQKRTNKHNQKTRGSFYTLVPFVCKGCDINVLSLLVFYPITFLKTISSDGNIAHCTYSMAAYHND